MKNIKSIILLTLLLLISFLSFSCDSTPSNSETEVRPDYDYLFQWHTNGFIENNLNDEGVRRVDLLISDNEGDVLGAFELFEESDGLVQFLSIDEYDIDDIPEEISVSLVYYYQYQFSTENYYQTAVNTYTNIKSGIEIGSQSSKGLKRKGNVDFNFGSDVNEVNSLSTESIYFELLDIDNEFNNRYSISSKRIGRSGGTYNGEIKENIELYGKDDNALFVSVYSSILDPNSDPRYWIVDEITDSISLNFQEGYGELTEKVVSTPNGAERIFTGGSISVNGISLSLPNQINFDGNKSYFLYPNDLEISLSYYSYTIEDTGLRHAKYTFGEVFSKLDEPMSAHFDVNVATIDSISVNQSGDHDVFNIRFSESDSNNFNSWNVIGLKGNDVTSMPKIDTYINTNHSNFYSQKLGLPQSVNLIDYDSFNEDHFLDYYLIPNESNYRSLEMPLN